MNEITRQIRQIKWVEIIRECNSSGIPKNQWIAEHGISSKSFYRYQKMLREHFVRDYLYGKSQSGQSNTREVDEWNNNAVAFPLQAASCPADSRASEEPAAIITVGQMTIRISNIFLATKKDFGVVEQSEVALELAVQDEHPQKIQPIIVRT